MRTLASVSILAALMVAPTPLEPSNRAERDWFARARGSLEQREYHASSNGIGLQAPNRSQDLRTYFETTGIRIHDRTAPGASELLALSLAGVGRGDRLVPPPPGEVTARGSRVEIRREGLVEWYENSAAGLEQGFTLAERPAGEGPLLVELATQGATASLRDTAVIFSAKSGRRLRYDKLVAIDASGRTLAARLSVPDPERVRIEVEDTGAAYPLVIDPILSGTADTVLTGAQPGWQFGASVAGAGDVNGDGYDDVIVGAPHYDSGQNAEGAAFVFLGSASGIADGGSGTAASRLEANQEGSSFGSSVAGAGDVNGDGYDDVIVAADRYAAGEENEGAVFVFLGSASGIADGDPGTAAAQLESNQARPCCSPIVAFGRGLAPAGDLNGDGYDDVAVGAPGYTFPGVHPNWFDGAAFVFLGSASGIADGNPDTADTFLGSNQASSGSARVWQERAT